MSQADLGLPPLSDYFSRLYASNDDPYALKTRWYEQRKRAIVLASLSRPRYANIYEPACGAAVLSIELAARCDRLLSSDGSADAVAIARRRLAGLPHVTVQQHGLPRDWPHAHGPFDLILLSELGYFLEQPDWRAVAEAAAQSLGEGGELLACDWRPDFAERRQSTQSVHAALEALQLERVCLHEESDFVLQLWSRDARSVAQREGIR